MRLFWVTLIAGLALSLGVQAAQTTSVSSSQGKLQISRMAEGFDIPWAFAFLPDGSLLVTEREGALYLVKNGRRTRVSGLPRVAAQGQGGLLDVMIPQGFAQSRALFLTFSKPQGRGANTALARAVLSPDGKWLTQVKILFEAAAGATGGRHFGSRVVEAADGSLLITVGDRGERPSAQDPASHQGKVLRIYRDGSIPSDNPFASTPGARPEIWTLGHRNPQGMARDGQGRIWTVEHGARGGDEVNLIRKGANYGWPVIAYGRHYSGAKIGEGIQKHGMEQPQWYWDPSIAPSGMMIYSGKMWPAWRGDFFVASLKFDMISRLSGTPLQEVERLQSDLTGRIRDIQEAPDGSIWFASETEGALFRISNGD
ncbi:PQQ-dependent sugar dehydrogenase [Phaeobacter sp. PT47_59]|uniref:PQQ-dependent sugar dehydrogenase n=1 Tax=Phaeobacter sp. PT47_59 TaxID=3029979 RepID=UPI0023805B62|nr:PQQ-dependent sugar dehydrogenase [Phaeobacter sp. PT47_59]MDE4175030.1 PQQ-dependent sugar dehydrogenase [Phaeobacter sp. PT47_59]